MVNRIQGASVSPSNLFSSEQLSPQELKGLKSKRERLATHGKESQKLYQQAVKDYQKAKGTPGEAKAKKRLAAAEKHFQYRYKLWCKYDRQIKYQEAKLNSTNRNKKRLAAANERWLHAKQGGLPKGFKKYQANKKVAKQAFEKNFKDTGMTDVYKKGDIDLLKGAIDKYASYKGVQPTSYYVDSSLLTSTLKNRKSIKAGI